MSKRKTKIIKYSRNTKKLRINVNYHQQVENFGKDTICLSLLTLNTTPWKNTS